VGIGVDRVCMGQARGLGEFVLGSRAAFPLNFPAWITPPSSNFW
jgi:hypothetical protein